MKKCKVCKVCWIEKSKEEFYINNKWTLSSRCKICHTLYTKENKRKNNIRESLYQNARNKRKTQELGFNWWYFHKKTIRYVLKNWGYPEVCPYCWEKRKIEIHHPFYRSFDDWKIFTFCCYICHSKIHKGLLTPTF